MTRACPGCECTDACAGCGCYGCYQPGCGCYRALDGAPPRPPALPRPVAAVPETDPLWYERAIHGGWLK